MSSPLPQLFPQLSIAARVLLLLLLPLVSAHACEQLTARATFWVRLSVAVSSYNATPGTPIAAVILESPACNGAPLLPVGLPLRGKVLSARKVGWGVRHETALLELAFDQIVLPGQPDLEIETRVVGVDNARESVRDGVIRGIRATDSPQGMINSRLVHLPTWNPYSDVGLIAYKALFPIFPEPEIYLPPGTDLRLELTKAVAVPRNLPPVSTLPAVDPEAAPALADILASLPARTQIKHNQEADLINLVLVGSAQQILDSLQAALWLPSDHLSKHTVLRHFHAFLAQSSYPTAPVSTQWYEGRMADESWQRSFDSYEKRDHLRAWKLSQEWNGRELWAVAAAREVGASLSFRHHRFVHHIQANLDEEREVILRDLTAAGCVNSLALLPRPALSNFLLNSEGESFHTDGNLLIIELRECQPATPAFASAPAQFHAGNKFFRYLRMQILTFHSDIFRANLVYASYYLTRTGIGAFRRSRHHDQPPVVPSDPLSESSCDWVCREIAFPQEMR